VRGVLVPAAMAVMGRGNWWWPGPRNALPQHRTALPQKTEAVADVDSDSIRDEKQAVAAFDDHAGATLTADVGEAERWPAQRYVSREPPTLPQKIVTTVHQGGAGVRDQKQAVGALDDKAGATCTADIGAAGTLPGRQQLSTFGAGRIHHAADVEQTIVLELPRQQLTG